VCESTICLFNFLKNFSVRVLTAQAAFLAVPIKILEELRQATEDELPDTVIYHKPVKIPFLHIAYVYVPQLRVKSAHITDKVKGGETLWMADTSKIKKLLRSK